MLFDVRVRADWGVEIADDTGAVIVQRQLDFCGDAPRFPLGTKNERDAFDAAQPSARLCRTDDPALIAKYFEAFIGKRRAVDDDAEPVLTLGRYLFAALLGTPAWTAIRDRAKSAPIELALAWHDDLIDLAALPWEAMHDGERFLVQHPNVGIVRSVGGGVPIAAEDLRIASPPKVLIVVGTEPRNDVIQAGVEYLRMIQALREADLDLALQTFLLLEASPLRLRSMIKQVQPDVVHFICHGGIDPNNAAYLELVDDDDKHRPVKIYATAIATTLQPDADSRMPCIVVITACESAAVPTRAGQIATPLASDLVKAGVALVVGMAGRVADQACRLFTRRFYEALLANGDVTHATAQGRRAAIAGGRSDPKSTVDWALPVLFFSESIRNTKLTVAVDSKEPEWHAITAHYQPATFPPFCDRAESFARFDVLNSNEPGQKLLRGKPFQAMVVNVPRRDKDAAYGCTRLLVELASKAIRDGHVVCLVAEPRSKTAGAPKSAAQLLERMVDAIDDTIINFNLACPACKLAAADFRTADSACETCADLRAIFDVAKLAAASEQLQADALRKAFVRVVQFARLLRPEHRRESMRLVLLVDDLHAMAPDAVAVLLDHYLSARGLRSARNDVRIVLGYCSVPRNGDESAVGAVKNWLGATNWAEEILLDRFSGAEEPAAYEHFLLHYEDLDTRQPRPMTIGSASRKQVLETLQRRLQGIPSHLLKRDVVQAMIDLDMNLLDDADDEARLKETRGSQP